MRTIVCLTGPIAGGKGFIADYLSELGYVKYSLSDRVREEAERRGASDDRKTLQDIGDELRRENGSGILAEMTISLIEKEAGAKNVVVDGIRNPGEIACLRNNPKIIVIGVTANKEIRFERSSRRGRSTDPKTRQEFDVLEARDRGIGQSPYGQAVDACLRLSDVVIENNGSYEEFKIKMESVLRNLSIEGNPVFPEGRRFRRK